MPKIVNVQDMIDTAVKKALTEKGYVQVVRCQDCKYYQPAGEWRGLCTNRQWYEEIKPAVVDTDFCCYAIRKGGKK